MYRGGGETPPLRFGVLMAYVAPDISAVEYPFTLLDAAARTFAGQMLATWYIVPLIMGFYVFFRLVRYLRRSF